MFVHDDLQQRWWNLEAKLAERFILAQAQPPEFLTCHLAQETCGNTTNGSYDVTEYYGEALIPVLKDMPFAEVLNVVIGTRFSDYSNFGTTLNSKLAVEYRPIGDLLLRASYADVFRAPTIGDLYAPAAANAPTFNDPCTGTTQPVGQDPNFDRTCENVPRDGSYQPNNSQVTGLVSGNSNLEPEEGEVITWGAVYDPEWLDGLSVTTDFWHYKIDNTIETLDVGTVASQCLATGSDQFCNLIQRFDDGQVRVIGQPTFNLGMIEADGVDMGVKYNFDDLFGFGALRLGLDTTYISKFDRTPDTTNPGFVLHNAGTFSRQDGNYSRIRAIGTANWKFQGYDVLYTTRYIHGFTVGSADPNRASADAGFPGVEKRYDATLYHSLAAGYDLSAWNTKIQIGIDNVLDEEPPLLYQNNVTNANTDVQTFDTIGRYFWASFTYSF